MNTTFRINRDDLFRNNYETNDITTTEGNITTASPEEVIASILAEMMKGGMTA